MSLYATADEERIRTAAQVRGWTRSGVLEPPQGAAIESGLRTDLRRTNRYLRIALFIFGTIVVWAAVGLWIVALDVNEDSAFAFSAIVAGVLDLALARFLVVRYGLYRFGVEEAFALWSAVLLAFGAGFLTSIGGRQGDLPMLVALVTAAIASVIVYSMFGYLYAAFAAAAAAAGAAFYLSLPRFAAHTVAALILIAAFLIARTRRRPYGDDYPGDDYGAIEAGAWVGAYAALNLRLTLDVMPSIVRSRVDVPSVFYWATYAAVWLLPVVGLALAVRDRHRPMLWASLIAAIGTLITNKPYLGWEQHTWDPILLGALLVGSAIAIRRWLLRAPGGHRHAFTPQSLVASVDREALGALSAFAATAQPFEARTATETPTFVAGRGGRSGGGGGGAEF